jgi:uncharacterized membrane protein
LQNKNMTVMEATELTIFRSKFETNWNFWNRFRLVNAVVSVTIMLFVLSQL